MSIAGAKGYFIVTGYAVQLLLPRIFGEAKEFGLIDHIVRRAEVAGATQKSK